MRVVLLCSVVLLAVTARAEEPPLELPALLSEVDAHAPLLQVRQAEVAASTARVGVAGAWEDPRITVMGTELGSGDPEAQPMISYRFMQPLTPLFGRRSLAKESARAQVDVARAGLERARWDARAQAYGAFYELWMNGAMGRVLAAQVSLLERLRDAAKARYGAGLMMGHHDVLRAEAELGSMLAEQASLGDERMAIAAMLNVLRGRGPEAPVGEPALSPREPLAGVDRFLEAGARRPEIVGAEAMKRQMEAERELAGTESLPMVMVGATFEQQLRMMNTFGAEVVFSVPLWWWDRQRNMVAMADAMVQRSERDVAAMTAMTAADVRMGWSRAKAAVAADEAAYASGTATFLTLLEASMALRTQEIERLRAVVGREAALYELERLVGADLRGGGTP
jgi:cobalt-zinc-cadmium efflux system outer membrane protein